jgi:Di-haem oxidoreductase, putative peroxidase
VYRRTFTARFYGTFTYQFSRQSTRLLPFFSSRANVSGEAGIAGNNQAALNWGPPGLQFNQSSITGLSDSTPSVFHNQTSAVSYLGTWSHRQHNIQCGGDYRWQQFNTLSQSNPRGLFTHCSFGRGLQRGDGITTLVFPNERDDTANCSPVASPQDRFNLGSAGPAEFDDVTAFAAFMRFLAQPNPAISDNTVTNGASLFKSVGCDNCHTVTLQTGPSSFGPTLGNHTIHPYSDFALHGMGSGLADQISQGLAAGDEFRTAPLWGAGQRLFFLHDGRTSDLMQAILAHSSQGNSQFRASEANAVTRNFSALSDSDKQALLNFLRSL